VSIYSCSKCGVMIMSNAPTSLCPDCDKRLDDRLARFQNLIADLEHQCQEAWAQVSKLEQDIKDTGGAERYPKRVAAPKRPGVESHRCTLSSRDARMRAETRDEGGVMSTSPPSALTITTTERGFHEYGDSLFCCYGTEIRVYESSACSPHVWLALIQHELIPQGESAYAHLNEEQVLALIERLRAWLNKLSGRRE